MAKLLLKFEDRLIQEVPLSADPVTIGRQPDNTLRIDNPAVSGHHAKVYSEGGSYVLEDAESFNGTYINNERISKIVLRDGDQASIGKHTIEFRDSGSQEFAAAVGPEQPTVNGRLPGTKAKPPQLDRTVFLDTAKAQAMLATAAAAASAGGPSAVQKIGVAQGRTAAPVIHAVHQTVGMLTIVEGRTDQKCYVLTSQLTAIGKSKMAGIRLKGWFAPSFAASIYRAEDGYFIAASGDKVRIKVNDAAVAGGKQQLVAGDVIEVAGIKAVFAFCEA